MAGTLAALDRSTGGAAPGGRQHGAAVPGDRLGDAMRRLQEAAAPFIQLLDPAIRESVRGIGLTAEE
jgi:hypothetical protein